MNAVIEKSLHTLHLTVMARDLAAAIDEYQLSASPYTTWLDGVAETVTRDFPTASIRAALNRVSHALRHYADGGHISRQTLLSLAAHGLYVEGRWAIHSTPLAGMVRVAGWNFAHGYWSLVGGRDAEAEEYLEAAVTALDNIKVGAPYGWVGDRHGTIDEWLTGSSR